MFINNRWLNFLKALPVAGMAVLGAIGSANAAILSPGNTLQSSGGWIIDQTGSYFGGTNAIIFCPATFGGVGCQFTATATGNTNPNASTLIQTTGNTGIWAGYNNPNDPAGFAYGGGVKTTDGGSITPALDPNGTIYRYAIFPSVPISGNENTGVAYISVFDLSVATITTELPGDPGSSLQPGEGIIRGGGTVTLYAAGDTTLTTPIESAPFRLTLTGQGLTGLGAGAQSGEGTYSATWVVFATTPEPATITGLLVFSGLAAASLKRGKEKN